MGGGGGRDFSSSSIFKYMCFQGACPTPTTHTLWFPVPKKEEGPYWPGPSPDGKVSRLTVNPGLHGESTPSVGRVLPERDLAVCHWWKFLVLVDDVSSCTPNTHDLVTRELEKTSFA